MNQSNLLVLYRATCTFNIGLKQMLPRYKTEAEAKSKQIIEAYHFLVGISPETHKVNEEEYTRTTSSSGIDDFVFKGQTLKITFQGGSVYEYFGVPKNIYGKLNNSPTPARFARRHIFHSYVFRKVNN